MLNNLKISTKLIVILAAPLVALVALAGTGAMERRDAAAHSKADEQLIVMSRLDADLAHQLNREMVLSARPPAAVGEEGQPQLAEQRELTDEAAAALKAEIDEFGADGADEETAATINLINRRLGALDTFRRAVDSGSVPPAEVTANYAAAVEEVASLQPRLVARAQGGTTTLKLEAMANLVEHEANAAYAASLLDPAVRSGQLTDPAAVQALTQAATDEDLSEAVYLATADPNDKNLFRSAVAGPEVALVADAEQRVLAGQPLTVDPAAWEAAVLEKLDRLYSVQVKLSDQLYAFAQEQSENAGDSANAYAIAAIFAVALSLVLAALVARAITRPLKRLTRSAQQLSQEQLPGMVESLKSPTGQDPAQVRASVGTIEVTGEDEVGQLAAAFNDVEKVAVEVATEQATLLRKGIGDMFVNLARRNQALLDRQIEFIDDLESSEEDPDALEHLYHLDHLATRMRRNAESLLVLAGAEPNRRRGRPIPLSDVVRAALGEVEDYARIELLQLDEVLVSSNAAADVAHLLSELMENASNYSPPDTKVEVVGHRTTSEGYVISVSDNGIGMSADQMAEANETLVHPPLVGLAMSRSLGFIVVGRLAARFGISVRLMPSPSAGVTAVVALPAAIIHEISGDAPAPASPPPTAPAESPGPADPGAERWAPQVVNTPSDILPPLEFSFGPVDEPETLEEAVPGSGQLDEELASLVFADDDGSPAPDPAGDDAAPRPSPLPQPATNGEGRPSLFGLGPEPAPSPVAGPEALPGGPEGAAGKPRAAAGKPRAAADRPPTSDLCRVRRPGSGRTHEPDGGGGRVGVRPATSPTTCGAPAARGVRTEPR